MRSIPTVNDVPVTLAPDELSDLSSIGSCGKKFAKHLVFPQGFTGADNKGDVAIFHSHSPRRSPLTK